MTSPCTAAKILSSLRFDFECPAVQVAIDQMAEEFREGRQGLIEYLKREIRYPSAHGSMNSVTCAVLERWQKSLPVATGLPLKSFL